MNKIDLEPDYFVDTEPKSKRSPAQWGSLHFCTCALYYPGWDGDPECDNCFGHVWMPIPPREVGLR